jgi:hypothetical protein
MEHNSSLKITLPSIAEDELVNEALAPYLKKE